MNAAALLIPLLVGTPQEADDPLAKVTATLEQARDAYAEAVDAARDDVIEDLKRALDDAKRKGALGSVEDLLDQRRAFLNEGTLPKSVNTRAYERVLSIELVKLERAYEAAVRDAVRLDRIGDAKRLRDERDAVRAKPSIAGRAMAADYVVTQGAKASLPLECGTKFLWDRHYVLYDVPDTLPVRRFAPMSEGNRGSVVIQVRRPGRVYVAMAEFNPMNKFPQSTKEFEAEGWTKTKVSFMHSAPSEKAKLAVFYKTFPAGKHEIKRVNYTGPTVLLP
ncbi:hypothetical protein [Alienimonas chondri]|uniref:DUF4384 domain-containing protein n=1 Tax=Alienimonas chondri TaxID=2681879 RepID=A0ABX1VAE3_9PLAN|nr:hypothetical protein [Alienimonas chondri]NNJ24915.1 hypothetical protein [Alienimonas chondri]